MRLGAKVYQIGTEQLRLNHTELAVYAHRCGTELSDAQVERLLYSSEGWFSAVYLNLCTLAERGELPEGSPDIYAMFSAALIDPLPEEQREQLFSLTGVLLEAVEAENAEQQAKLKGENENG